MIDELIKLGYCVDVVNYDYRTQLNHRYDLIIGFGLPYCSSYLSESGLRLLFLAETHPMISLRNETDRLNYYNERHQGSLKKHKYRSTAYYDNKQFECASMILALNNKALVGTNIDAPIEKLRSFGIFSEMNKITEEPGRDFLIFGASPFLLKGLDLAIEAFRQLPEVTLHVCGLDEKFIPKNLVYSSNVKFYKHVKVGSKKYLDLIRLCSFTLSLSCAEGCPSGIVTTMYSGLIPIVTDVCDDEFRNFGIMISNKRCTPSYLSSLFRKLFRLSDSTINERKCYVQRQSRKHFSEEIFRSKFSEIIIKNGVPRQTRVGYSGTPR